MENKEFSLVVAVIVFIASLISCIIILKVGFAILSGFIVSCGLILALFISGAYS